MEVVQEANHFILVHGATLGAWVWYKIKPRLESAGHRVTAIDMSASGINPKKLDELRTLEDYSLPLLEMMASLPASEKVILVGHSLGGLNLALAMEKYPNKISVAVFVTALMPDTTHRPSYVVEEYIARTPVNSWLDTQFSSFGNKLSPLTSMVFGPKFVSRLYHLSPPEDVELAKMLMRPSSLFMEDLTKANYEFSKNGFGSVKRAYVICEDDKVVPKEFQNWLIQNNPVEEVKEIKGADHMSMCSKPQQLCDFILDVAIKYS